MMHIFVDVSDPSNSKTQPKLPEYWYNEKGWLIFNDFVVSLSIFFKYQVNHKLIQKITFSTIIGCSQQEILSIGDAVIAEVVAKRP